MELAHVSKVSSNDTMPLVYLSKAVRERAGIERGDYVVMHVRERGRVIMEKLLIGNVDIQKKKERESMVETKGAALKAKERKKR